MGLGDEGLEYRGWILSFSAQGSGLQPKHSGPKVVMLEFRLGCRRQACKFETEDQNDWTLGVWVSKYGFRFRKLSFWFRVVVVR